MDKLKPIGPTGTKNFRLAEQILENLPDTYGPIQFSRPLTEEETKLRYLTCPYYNQCLTIASCLCWVSFICTDCPMWKEKEND